MKCSRTLAGAGFVGSSINDLYWYMPFGRRILNCRGIFMSTISIFIAHGHWLLNKAGTDNFISCKTIRTIGLGSRSGRAMNEHHSIVGDFITFLNFLSLFPFIKSSILTFWMKQRMKYYINLLVFCISNFTFVTLVPIFTWNVNFNPFSSNPQFSIAIRWGLEWSHLSMLTYRKSVKTVLILNITIKKAVIIGKCSSFIIRFYYLSDFDGYNFAFYWKVTVYWKVIKNNLYILNDTITQFLIFWFYNRTRCTKYLFLAISWTFSKLCKSILE